MARVLLLYQPTDGGVGRHLASLSTGLTALGHEVVLCGPRPPDGAPSGVRHERLELTRAVDPLHDASAVRRLTAILRAVRPALVHAHSSKAGAVGRLARVGAPATPVLYTPHGYAFAGFFETEWQRKLYRGVERALAPLASTVLCVCEAEARLARSVGPAGRVRVVHNGVSLPAPGPIDIRMAELREAGPVLCTLTQLRPGKGLETLLAALPRVLAERPDAQLAIWGDGPDLAALQALASRLDVHGAVHFLGQTADPARVLRGADLFVLPSWAEAFPYVILEAMASGLPVVATDVGGVSEAVGPQSGRVVPARAPEPLSDALLELLLDPELAGSLGHAARAVVEERFTEEAMVDGTARVYGELVPAFS